jgi:hypothetical protein
MVSGVRDYARRHGSSVFHAKFAILPQGLPPQLRQIKHADPAQR